VKHEGLSTFTLTIGIAIIAVVIGVSVYFLSLGGEEELPAGGPYYSQIYSATSSDGIHWTVDNTLLFDHADVPGAVYFNGKLYLYYVNADFEGERLRVGISEDRGATFTTYDVQISGSNSPNPVDPTALVDGNQIRLTYLGNLGQGETNKIVTATSTDGIHFTEEGVIFTGDAYDPDLFYDESSGQWVLLTGVSGVLTKATASSLDTQFTTDPSFTWTLGEITSTHRIGNKYYTYYMEKGRISVAEYENGELSKIADGIVDGGNPTVAIFGENDYKMFFTRSTA